MAYALTTGDYLRRRLRPLATRLRLRDTLLLASRTLWIGAAGFALVQIAGRLLPIPNLLLWSLVPPLLWILVILGYLIVRPLPLPRVAQRVDSALDLRERLATALELSRRAEQEPLDEQQQADARAHADTLRPRMLPLRLDRRPLLLALVPLAIGLASALLPNPQDRVLQERAAVQQSVNQTANQIHQIQQQIAQDQTLTPEQRAQLEKELADLERKLRENPGNREQALADLSTAEARLQQRLDPSADARRAALEQLARNLQGLSGQQPTQRPSIGDAAAPLNQLAQQLGSRRRRWRRATHRRRRASRTRRRRSSRATSSRLNSR
jgi:hypothetical protein